MNILFVCTGNTCRSAMAAAIMDKIAVEKDIDKSDMKNITITRMTDDDVAEIAELEKKCFAVPWSEKSFRDEMQNKLAVYFVAKDNGKCIGYAGLWNVSGEGDITNVAVLPKYRKNGIGSMLISDMITTPVT